MKLAIQKQLQLSPWDLMVMLHNSGVIPELPCAPDVQIVERNELNNGQTVILKWAVRDEEIPSPEIKKD